MPRSDLNPDEEDAQSDDGGGGYNATGDVTVADIAVVLADTYKPEGVVHWIASHREQFATEDGRRALLLKADGLRGMVAT